MLNIFLQYKSLRLLSTQRFKDFSGQPQVTPIKNIFSRFGIFFLRFVFRTLISISGAEMERHSNRLV